MRFLDPNGRQTMREAGADIDEAEMMVRLDPDMVREHLANAPPRFGLRARNPERDLSVGDNNIIFGSTLAF